MPLTATLAAGPFRRVAPAFRDLRGVVRVICGYTGGVKKEPTFDEVATGRTGHIEAVEISYFEDGPAYNDLLETFWSIHDPTAMNFTGADDGAQHRSAIFFHNDAQQKTALSSLANAQRRFGKPIVTLIEPAREFWPAPDTLQMPRPGSPDLPGVPDDAAR